MSEPTLGLEERIVKLERIMFTMRIAVVVLVGFMIYDSLAPDTGSSIIFADKIKSRQFVLLGPGDEAIGYWDYKDTKGLKLYSKEGNHVIVSPDAVTFYQDKLNPEVKSKYD